MQPAVLSRSMTRAQMPIAAAPLRALLASAVGGALLATVECKKRPRHTDREALLIVKRYGADAAMRRSRLATSGYLVNLDTKPEGVDLCGSMPAVSPLIRSSPVVSRPLVRARMPESYRFNSARSSARKRRSSLISSG